jgi:hypothetical protein
MSRSTTDQQSDTSEELKTVKQRAQQAEQRVEELEERLQAVENSRQTQPSKDNERQQNPSSSDSDDSSSEQEALQAMRNEPMMDHLLNALDSRQDIGHYGRLVFAMIGHHFLSEETLLQWLSKDPGTNQNEAAALLRQVEGRNYNPPRRDRILAWQSQQEFPILPNPDDPDCGNVYRNLKFPQSVYEHIQEYQEEKVQAEEHSAEVADSR